MERVEDKQRELVHFLGNCIEPQQFATNGRQVCMPSRPLGSKRPAFVDAISPSSSLSGESKASLDRNSLNLDFSCALIRRQIWVCGDLIAAIFVSWMILRGGF